MAGRVRRAGTVLGVLLVVGSIPASPPAGGQTSPTFGGYDGVATGFGMSLAPRVPGLLPVETPIEGTASLALASLSTGNQGFGRASTFFPGTLFVGLRPLLSVGTGNDVPIPDYPVVVESREYEDAHQSQVPGLTMRSDVDPDRATAVADTGGFIVPTLVTVGSVDTISEVLLTAGRLSSTVHAEANGIDIAASAVHIDSVESVAEAATDGAQATCSGTATVSGATVGGTPVTIDENGVHASGDSVVPGVDAGTAVAQALAASGLEMRVIGGANGCDGADASQTTTGLLVSMPLPAAGQVVGSRVDMIITSASATAAASAPFDLSPVDPPPRATPAAGAVARVPGPVSGGAVLSAARPQAAAAPPAAAPAPAGPATPVGSTSQPIAYSFDGIPMSLALGGLLLAVFAARRVRRYLERLITLTAS